MSLLALGVAGCHTQPVQTPQERIQQQAAQSAQQLRHDLRDAGKEARKAIREAGKTTKAVVTGARQGWDAGAPARSGAPIDINHASAASLEDLPGISASAARRIVASRPYAAAADLRKKHILTPAEYARIAARIEAD